MSEKEKRERSVYLGDLQIVIDVMVKLQEINANVFDASIVVQRDSGSHIAEIWWDDISEDWLVDWTIT